MNKKYIYYVLYTYKDNVEYKNEEKEDGIPKSFLNNDSKLKKAIRAMTIPTDVEIYKYKQNVLVTDKGYYVACYESSIELNPN